VDFRETWTRRHALAGGVAAAAASLTGQAARAQTGVQTLAKSGRRPKYIVDCQVHVWSEGKPSSLQRQRPFLAKDLLKEMSAAGVNRAVVVTPSWSASGNGYPLEAVRANPDRLRLMGIFDISAPPNPGALENWKQQQGMLGIRMFLGSPKGQAWLTDGSSDWFWPVAERANIPLMIFPGNLTVFAALAEKYPGLKFSIDSFGVPTGIRGQAAFANYDAVLALARYPNVTIKAECVPFLSTEPYPYRDMQPILRRTYDAFGPARMFWGSDITLLIPTGASYSDCVRAFTEELIWLSDKDLDLIMGRGVSDWIGWPLPS
jgi:predicted TIM-barrel fold metal-dependent hydrolase